MRKIIVCVKQVMDISVPPEIDHMRKSLVEDGIVYILNPADRCAVEAAVRFKEQFGQTEVIVITLGPSCAQSVLRECLAMGADQAIHLLDKAFDNSDAYATAFALAQEIRVYEFGMILCGSRSLDNGAAFVGPCLAELLKLPQVSAITQLEISSDASTAIVHRRLLRGNREVVQCPLPAVFSVEASINQPRYPSLPAHMAAIQKEIQVHDLASLGLRRTECGKQGSLTKVLGVSPPRPRPKKVATEELTPQEQMRRLMSGQLGKNKGGDLLEGDSDYLAEQMLRFLRKQSIVP